MKKNDMLPEKATIKEKCNVEVVDEYQSQANVSQDTLHNTITDDEVVSEGELDSCSNSTSQLDKEIGGRKGPEPTRFGDWEKNGRCIDF